MPPRLARFRPLASRALVPGCLAAPPQNPAQTVSGQPDPYGVGLARDSSPLHPRQTRAAGTPPIMQPYTDCTTAS